MADKQFALGGTRSAGYVEDEDPFAELARIVGFQEQPAAKQRPEANQRIEPVVAGFPNAPTAPSQPVQAHNPVADLEDELLRAFEVYDSPRSITQPPPAVNANFPAARTEPEQVATAAVPASPAVSDDDDPFAALAAVVASQPMAPVRPAAEAPAARQEPRFEVAPVQAPAQTQAAADEPVFSTDFLEQELLESLEEAELAAPAAEPVAVAAPKPQPKSLLPDTGFRMPLANFHKPQAEPAARAEPEFAPVAADVAAQPVQEEIAWDLPGIEADDVVVMDPPMASEQSARAAAPDVVAVQRDVPARTPVLDPAFNASLAAISGVASGIGGAPAREPEVDLTQPMTAWDAADVNFDAPGDEPDLDDLFGPGDFELDLDAFEQQLSDLSFDDEIKFDKAPKESPLEAFADFVSETEAHAEVTAPEPAPRREEPVSFVPSPREERVPDFTTEPAFGRRAPAGRDVASYQFGEFDSPVAVDPSPRREAPVAVQPVSIPTPDYTIDENAPFDPAMLAESEDTVEAVGEIDVPELKVEPEEEPAVVVPDYDIDIDAEMASLFGSLPPLNAQPQAARPVMTPIPQAHPAPASGFGASSSGPALPGESFDEFERAIEDDFRTMLTQPLGSIQSSHGTPLQPSQAHAGGSDGRTLRAVLLAACATGVIALAGAGGYMFLTRDGGKLAGGEPRVILADKSPTKVVPENPGGVTVPNQDKAVYDRVAGKEAEQVKQQQLVTTEEQPVDVVQKTLVPENTLNNEAENQASAPTPVEDTKDARLLPADQSNAQAPAANGAAQDQTPGGVAVRKVKTMVVKADGTLVPREDTAPTAAASAPAAQNTTSAQAPAAQTPAVPTADASKAQQPAPATEAPAAATTPATDLRTADAPKQDDVAAAASAETLASVANSNVAAQPTARPTKTSKVSDQAPVPQARPSDQPVNVTTTVTEKGKVKPATEAQQTASAEPAAQPAAAPGSYGIQIASLPSEADAKASIPKMSAKFGGVIGGRAIGIRKADIPGKGTYYRLRVDVGSKDEAVNLCLKLKAAGGSCLVSK